MGDSTPEQTPIGRVALRASDRHGLAEFYEDVLGLETHRADGDRTVLGAGDRSLLVVLDAADAPERGRFETGLFHLAVRVPDRAGLADALARVEDGWDLGGASDHRVSEALYLTDPEGNGVEIYRDRPRETWPETDDGRVEMDTLPLDLDAIRAASDGSPARSVPDGTRIGHVHLEVSDLDAARSFYVDGLGLRERARYGASASFLAVGDYHHHVGLNTWNGRTGPGEGRGLAWWELRLPDGTALSAAIDRLEARGADVRETDEGAVATDPDGIELHLHAGDDR